MRLTICGVKVAMTDELRSLVERRFQFALARFEDHLDSVRVTLHDQNGPRQGIDQECRVMAHLKDGHQVVVRELQATAPAAASLAADRLVHSIGRVVEKRRRHDHSPVM